MLPQAVLEVILVHRAMMDAGVNPRPRKLLEERGFSRFLAEARVSFAPEWGSIEGVFNFNSARIMPVPPD